MQKIFVDSGTTDSFASELHHTNMQEVVKRSLMGETKSLDQNHQKLENSTKSGAKTSITPEPLPMVSPIKKTYEVKFARKSIMGGNYKTKQIDKERAQLTKLGKHNKNRTMTAAIKRPGS